MEPMRPSVLAAKFWNEEVESTRSLDAFVHSVPNEPPASGLMRGSKLSRSQQLLMLQRLFGVPFTPSVEPPSSVNFNYGGLVLDRVLASVGGSTWWTTITGRLRAQRLMLLGKQNRERRQDTSESSFSDSEHLSQVQDEKWWDAGKRLLDPSLYALSMRSRFQVASHTTLSVSSEVDSVNGLFTTQPESRESNQQGFQSPWRGRFSLRHKVAEAHDWILESAICGRFVDREARYWEVPQVTTVDMASVGLKRGGLRYRIGLHHSSGPPIACPKAEGAILGEVPLGAQPGFRAQAAFSVEQEQFLWKKSVEGHKTRKPYSLLASRPGLSILGIAGGLVSARICSHSEQVPRNAEADEGESDDLSSSSWRSNLSVEERSGPVSADLFASLGINAQLGLFQKLLLDHTKVSVHLDLGAASALSAATRHSGPSATHLHHLNRSVNEGLPTVTLCLQQQLVGPFCARADSRFSIDPANIRKWPPSLQEVTYGVDFPLEKLGAFKLVFWYSPTKCEGMAELRILER